ncbi:uncharacterized protein OCT59_011419 [Rhizophagus irregularis]|uniref:F-box domain-containing protein n=2 Tax=Rhizophagus irregularis TaxID=588596 RepID=A0A015JT93_RHIIW|nr:hypothetical protein RirG_271610 [Rhizophagus irregularis DAOM 197198w]UZO20162.1 hypothetical protein OCT59_011419 [Rhizophagus irregularis]GBC23886.1 hypothetical protein GLOIN_2v1876445 [Rhizophagus irregularis DAOM 181602=DAOM 197198]
MSQLDADCLNEIFGCLEKDKATLYSCLLVNRFWCQVSVRILWKEPNASTKVLNTLIICLPDESKNFLYNNGIILAPNLKSLYAPDDYLCKKEIISAPTWKPPLFNYVSYCKVLSIYKIHSIVKLFLTNNQQSINTKKYINLLTQEILKMFMSVSLLNKLSYTCDVDYSSKIKDLKISDRITFVHSSGARYCLTNLSEFTCTSNINSEVFNQLSKICHNIQSLNIRFNKYADTVSNGLKDLISSQNNLKSLSIYYESYHWADIIPSLMKHSDTLIKLSIKGEENHWPLSFIKVFNNLQELNISLSFINEDEDFEYFKDLQHFTFPHLRKLNVNLPTKFEPIVVKFLENNGENLEEFQSRCKCKNSSINRAVNDHCPKLKSLHTIFGENLSGLLLRNIFKKCKKLESIEIFRRGSNLSGKELLKIVAENSPKNFHELKFHNYYAELDV